MQNLMKCSETHLNNAADYHKVSLSLSLSSLFPARRFAGAAYAVTLVCLSVRLSQVSLLPKHKQRHTALSLD